MASNPATSFYRQISYRFQNVPASCERSLSLIKSVCRNEKKTEFDELKCQIDPSYHLPYATELLQDQISPVKVYLDLRLFVPCFPASLDLLMSLGQQGLIIILLKSGPTLGLRRVVPHYSPIKVL